MNIYAAISRGKLNRVKELLNQGVSVNARDQYGRTPLHLAAQMGHLNVVKELLNRGANKNARRQNYENRNHNGFTPLHDATWHKKLNIVKELLRRGARPNPRDASGLTPLHYVGQTPRIAHELIKAGANPKYTNKMWGVTPHNWIWNFNNNNTRNALKTSRAASKFLKPIRKREAEVLKREAERMLMSPRLLGSVFPNNAIRSISKYLTVKKKNNNK
jgi:ankyrin repeat protein